MAARRVPRHALIPPNHEEPVDPAFTLVSDQDLERHRRIDRRDGAMTRDPRYDVLFEPARVGPVTIGHDGHYGWFDRARLLTDIDEQLADLSRC